MSDVFPEPQDWMQEPSQINKAGHSLLQKVITNVTYTSKGYPNNKYPLILKTTPGVHCWRGFISWRNSDILSAGGGLAHCDQELARREDEEKKEKENQTPLIKI